MAPKLGSQGLGAVCSLLFPEHISGEGREPEAGQAQVSAWSPWGWRPGKLANSRGGGTPRGWKAWCPNESYPDLVSSPSTAGGYLAKNFMQFP